MWILGQTKDHDKVREMFYETINHDISLEYGWTVNEKRQDSLSGFLPLHLLFNIVADEKFLYLFPNDVEHHGQQDIPL